MTNEGINFSKETIAPSALPKCQKSDGGTILNTSDVPCEHCTCGKKV